MENRRHFIKNIMEQHLLDPEIIPGYPIVEIAGEHRVLIENHHGVAAYGKERILVKVKFGSICICGCNLEIARMTKEQLVICGIIHSVGLQRRR